MEITMTRTSEQRMLLRRDQVLDELMLGEDQLEDLIESQLLTEVRIRGHRRFDSAEVDELQSSTSMPSGGAHASLLPFRGRREYR